MTKKHIEQDDIVHFGGSFRSRANDGRRAGWARVSQLVKRCAEDGQSVCLMAIK